MHFFFFEILGSNLLMIEPALVECISFIREMRDSHY